MRTLCLFIFTTALCSAAWANEIQVLCARLNIPEDHIEIEVRYSACTAHELGLQLNYCTRATPTTCVAEVVDRSAPDACRSVLRSTLKIPASQFISSLEISGLNRLVILGAEDTLAEIAIP